MAYGSHHFLTSFKFQCASRESFLFGKRIFDVLGVREALDHVHLLTVDAYSRNLNPAKLGDRVAILLTLEEWGRSSARFCYRVIDAHGKPICAGFQTLLCADANTGSPIPLPQTLWKAMEAMREIEEPQALESFRDRVLAGGNKIESLFTNLEQETAIRFLTDRYPSPQVIAAALAVVSGENGILDESSVTNSSDSPSASDRVVMEAWVFSGQGTFEPQLLSERIVAYTQSERSARQELDQCAAVVQEIITGDAIALVSGSSEQCAVAVKATPGLSQVAIHLQNVLGALLKQSYGHPPGILMGHSFGEIAALGIGGCFDLLTGVRIVCERVRAVAEHAPPDGGLLAVSTDRPRVATEASLLGLDQVVIAGRNHEQQTVASGPRDQLKQLREYLRSIDINAVIVPSPTLFHHPQLRPAALAWLKQLNALPISGPSRAVYSPIGRRFISPDDDIAATLVSQFLRPFDLQGGISDVIEEGVTKFVDCGSSGSLARIISKAGTNGIDVSGIETNDFDTRGPRNHSTTSTAPVVPRLTDQVAVRAIGNNTKPEEGTNDTKHVVPPVAIVGQGCILPGGTDTPEQLYLAILEQRIGIVDQRRFDPHWSEDFYSEKLVADRSTSHLTGLVNDADIVAPAGIELDVFDGFTRAQRLLCIALAPCVASLEGANRVLCLIGATADGFEDQDVVSSLRLAGMDPTDQGIDKRMNTARSAFQEPHDAVQEVFDRIVRPGLKVVLVDAACASSLYAVALGMQALESNETDVVIAGGVFCPGPGNSCLFSQFHGTTSTGCRPFDAKADGVVFSEGSAVVALRRTSDAEQLGLPISSILRGAGLSSDGRSSSANVPQTHGQLLSLERCYANYGIDPVSIQAIEGHGTSTPVGDATELETLRQFFVDRAQKPIPLHSLKGLLGHAGWAAGTASIIAVCEYMRHRRFPAQACHREPSEALVKSSGTLTVPERALSLPARQCRIAIDGFGFGGANAHLVLDSYAQGEQALSDPRGAKTTATAVDDDLVFVAYRELVPTLPTTRCLQFDRQSVKVPEGHVLLPDLADDMDISQTLAILLADEVIAQIPQFDSAMRRETGVVLAQSGKTERGVEATMRVLAPRLRRNLAGLDQHLERLAAANDRARPSGPYTLQCMMPNVSAGRSALQLNLNGPNFVVDSGSNSLEAAMESTSLLLRNGDKSKAKLVIVTAIDANPWRVPRCDPQASEDEYAATFAVTTRRYAEESGMNIVTAARGPMQNSCGEPGSDQAARTTAQKVRALLDALDATADGSAHATLPDATIAPSSTESEFPIHVPVWVEAPLPPKRAEIENLHATAILAIVPDIQEQVEELVGTLPSYSQRHMVVVVGPTASEVASNFRDSNVICADLSDEYATATVLDQVDEFAADVVVAAESVRSWDLSEALTNIATDNSFCEFLFLVAQRSVTKLKHGTIELWGLFLEAWNGRVHPLSGAITGLLKAVNRETPAARTGVICTRGLSLTDALGRVFVERLHGNVEQEIVYDGTLRLARRLRRNSHVIEAFPQVKLNAKSVVLATGGARGVTAVLMEALLRDYQCTVVALGRSSLEAGPTTPDDPEVERDFYDRFVREHPNASAAEMNKEFKLTRARWEAHQTIQQLSSLGGRIEYRVADVTDRKQVASVIQQIASEFGPIDLLVHGAGVQVSKRLEHRSLAEFRRTFSVKVSGLRNLVDHCRTQFGRTVCTHFLTSAYSIFGNDGQHDYGAANETLDRLCGLSKIDDDPGWSSIAWLAWDGIGMTHGSEYHALAKERGLSRLTVENGQHVFRQALARPSESGNHVPISAAEHVKYEVKTIPPPTEVSTGRVLELGVELSKIKCLPYHKVRRTPTLPGAWILERMVHAGLQLRKDAERITSVTVQDVIFSRFVRYSAELEPNIRVVAEETDDGIVVWMIGDILHPTGATLSKDLVFAQAVLGFERETTELQPSLRDVSSHNVSGFNRMVNDPYCSGRCNDVELSGPFDCVRDIAIGPIGRRASFVPNEAHDCTGVIPALLLDSAWRVGAMYAVPGQNELYVPVHIGRLIAPIEMNAGASLASTWEIRTTSPRVENGNIRWDRTEVLNEIGALKLVVEDAFATPLK